MFKAIATLESISPYSQGKYIDPELFPKKDKELARNYEKRMWRERMHVTKEGLVFIPPMAFKNCLSEAARYLSVQVPGRGKTTYTKHFEAGVLVMDALVLPDKKEDVKGEWLFVPSDGKRGGGTRVPKCFPLIPAWEGEAIYYILDGTITEDVFEYHLKQAGSFIGLGRFRPRNNGFYGRFKVNNVEWGPAEE